MPSVEATRILCHFSCGAASAVAWKVAAMRYGGEANVEAVYCASVERDEHADNARFLADVEAWVGAKVTKLRNATYQTVNDVFLGERFIVGPRGASCTRVLKREVADRYAQPEDRHVLGLTADEAGRIANYERNNPHKQCLWVLAAAGITKGDCYRIIQSAGIDLPAMYRLGYDHNNCIGCVKGGKGYWNKIRRDFPDVFAARAVVQRQLNVGFNSGGKLFFLDELDPDEGRDVPEPDIECGVFCSGYTGLLQQAAESSHAER